MNKALPNLLRCAFVAVCCFCGMWTSAQIPTVVAAGGTTSDALCCTIGDTFAGEQTGLWAMVDANVTSGIDGIYSDGEIIVDNSAANKTLNVQLPDAMIAEGAFYNVYNLSGMLLESNRIDTTPYAINYGQLIDGQVIIVTVNTSKGVVATYKITK